MSAITRRQSEVSRESPQPAPAPGSITDGHAVGLHAPTLGMILGMTLGVLVIALSFAFWRIKKPRAGSTSLTRHALTNLETSPPNNGSQASETQPQSFRQRLASNVPASPRTPGFLRTFLWGSTAQMSSTARTNAAAQQARAGSTQANPDAQANASSRRPQGPREQRRGRRQSRSSTRTVPPYSEIPADEEMTLAKAASDGMGFEGIVEEALSRGQSAVSQTDHRASQASTTLSIRPLGRHGHVSSHVRQSQTTVGGQTVYHDANLPDLPDFRPDEDIVSRGTSRGLSGMTAAPNEDPTRLTIHSGTAGTFYEEVRSALAELPPAYLHPARDHSSPAAILSDQPPAHWPLDSAGDSRTSGSDSAAHGQYPGGYPFDGSRYHVPDSARPSCDVTDQDHSRDHISITVHSTQAAPGNDQVRSWLPHRWRASPTSDTTRLTSVGSRATSASPETLLLPLNQPVSDARPRHRFNPFARHSYRHSTHLAPTSTRSSDGCTTLTLVDSRTSHQTGPSARRYTVGGASPLSTTDVSEPLRDTLVHTNYIYPRNGLSQAQMRFLNSQEHLDQMLLQTDTDVPPFSHASEEDLLTSTRSVDADSSQTVLPFAQTRAPQVHIFEADHPAQVDTTSPDQHSPVEQLVSPDALSPSAARMSVSCEPGGSSLHDETPGLTVQIRVSSPVRSSTQDDRLLRGRHSRSTIEIRPREMRISLPWSSATVEMSHMG
ncbi:hypothetical protein E5Q_03722 [Mixia osmundae IAM 14324]|uniref:Uncharacterized protein n=1 Tax=Mixia osmundae (strain CBS 9802 / IAM 14324 / JCM 22182 / KY 12970) TaxID=764103 RepID=G7E2I7_MIXOS|nr:hypothetical protein E5Q_03722 [Mixia osmundae IAM 14324]